MPDCNVCGAMVGDEAKHDQWHADIDDLSATADDALDRAEAAQNVLYQNNIGI